jgi:hypothetical protein
MNEAGSRIDQLAASLGRQWPHLRRARQASIEVREVFKQKPFDSEDLDIVAAGSLAPNEFRPRSDIDWTLLMEGSADPVLDGLGATLLSFYRQSLLRHISHQEETENGALSLGEMKSSTSAETVPGGNAFRTRCLGSPNRIRMRHLGKIQFSPRPR